MAEARATGMNEPFRALGLHSAMYVIPLCSVLLAAVLLGAARTVSRDMGELQLWMPSPAGPPPAVPLAELGVPEFRIEEGSRLSRLPSPELFKAIPGSTAQCQALASPA